MSLEASGLRVVVESVGVNQATDALNKLAVAGDKAEKSTAKLAKANKGAEASAKQQEKLWYDLLAKSAKFYEQQYNAQQRHNNRLYGLVQAEANKMNRIYDRQVAQDAASFAKRRAQEQSQLEALDTMRHKAAAKEYARAQAEATRMNALLDRQRKQQEAAAKASAERQRVLNSNYSASSLAQQIATLQRAQQYGAQGGNISQRFGSQVAGASSSGELERLQRQYRQLDMEARRANRTMADTHAAVRGLSGSLGALWMTYGSLLPLLAGAAVGAAIKGIVDVGADIEHTLEKIRVLGQATTGEIDQMRQKVLELGKGVQGPRDVAEAFSVLTLAGLNAKEAMQGVGAALNLAIAGDVSIEKASTTLVQISTSLGYAAQDFDHIADVIAKTAAVSMSSVDSISGAFLSAAAVGEVYGASLQDIGLGLATVANLGIQATAAGTTLKNFYADLSKGTDKSTKALKAMGLSLRDLKTEDGGFINLVDLVYKLEAGFEKLNPQARAEAMDKLFGERGIKTGAALIQMVNQVSDEVDAFGNTYKNRLEEVADQINKSAAFSTLAAIAMAQTTNNQLKSVANTLQTALGAAFASVAPQISVVARELKSAFASPEFANGIRTIAVGVADLTKAIVTNFDWIVKLVAAYAAFKVTMFAAGLVQIAQGFTVATVAARAFTISLGPIGVAIAGLTALWAIYKATKNDALNNTAGAQNLSDYADGVIKAAETENEVAALREKGASEMDIARKRQMEDDKNAAAAAIKISKKGVDDMRDQLNADLGNLTEYQKKRVQLVKSGQAQFTGDSAAQKYIEKEKAYTAALQTHNNQVKVVTAATENLIRTREKNAAAADKLAQQNRIKPTGDGDLASPESEKAAAKAVKFVQNEALELAKLTAGYEAKNAAMMKSIELGKAVMAETQQAIVLENLMAGKYGSNKTETNEVYLKQKKLALAADEAKAENERLKKVTEFANKLSGLEAAQDEYNKTAVDGSMTHFGALRKEAEEVIKLNSLYGEAADKLRVRADAMDVYRKQQEAIAKLDSATSSANQRSEQAREEADLMLQYGEKTKLAAMHVAELTIQKSKLSEATARSAINALREAAASEQLSNAYMELAKQQVDLNKELEDAYAESLLIFKDSESEKIKIAAETQKKLAGIRLQEASEAAMKTGDLAEMENIYAVYAKNVAKIDEIASVKTNNLKLKDWKKTIDDIEQIGREGFYNLTEEGVGLWSAMAKTFKSMFKTTVMDYIYKEFAKPIILKVVAQIAGVIGADGLASAANASVGSGGSGTTITSAVTKLYDIFKSGGSFGQSVTKGVQAGLDKLGLSQSGGQPGAFAQGAGTVAGYAAGAAAGIYGGRAISGGYALSGSGNGLVNAGTAVGAVVGGPIGAAIGGTIAGGINRLFGRKEKEVTSKGISGWATTNGIEQGIDYTKWKQEGGLLRSDKSGMDIKSVDQVISNTFAAGFNEIIAATTGFAEQLGVAANDISGYGKYFDIALTDDMEKNQEVITKFFSDLGDDLAVKLIPNIMSMAKQGETASQVMERLGNTFAATKNVADILGKSVTDVFGSDGLSSEKARTKFVDLSGGADAVSQKASAYVNAIYSDTEKLAPVQKALAEAMSNLGLAGVKTKEQFKQVVDGLNLTKDADISLFNSLMELAPAFAEVSSASEALAKAEKERADNLMSQRLELEGRIAELTGNTAEATRVLAAQRAIELSKLDASLQPLQTRVWMLEDEAVAAEKAATLTNSRLDLESQIAALTKNTAMASEVLAAQRAIELSKMDESLRPLQTRVWALEDEATAAEKAAEAAEKNKEAIEAAITRADEAFSRLSDSIAKEKEIVAKIYDEAIESVRKKAEAEKTAVQEQLDQAEAQKSAIKSVFDALTNALKSTQVESAALTKARRVEAQSYLQVAAIQAKSGGDITKLPGLDNALEMIAKPSEELFSTFEDYARDQALTANVIGSLQGTAQTQLSAAELTIERLNATIEAIDKNAAATIEGFEKARDAELANLDSILEKAQSQIDAIKGVDNSVQSLTQAIMGFAASVAGVTATQIQQTQGTDAAIQSLYQNLLGRNADKEGGAFYSDKVKNGTPITSVADAIKNSSEYTTKVIEQMYRNVFNREADAGGLAFYQDALKRGASLFDIEQSFKNSAEYEAMKGLPSFDVGTNFVTHDTPAMVHRGERIMPASDNRRIIELLSSSTQNDNAVTKEDFARLEQAIIAGDVATVQTLKEILRLEKKWDQEGQPEIRNVELEGN